MSPLDLMVQARPVASMLQSDDKLKVEHPPTQLCQEQYRSPVTWP